MVVIERGHDDRQIRPANIHTYGMKIIPYNGTPDVSIMCNSEEGEYRVMVTFWTPNHDFARGIYVNLHPLLHLDTLDSYENILIHYSIFKESLHLSPEVDRLKYFSDVFASFIADRFKLHVAKLDETVYVLGFTEDSPENSAFCGGGSILVRDLDECIEYSEEENLLLGSMEVDKIGWVYKEVSRCK